MRSKYQIEVVEDTVSGGTGYVLVDGFRGDEFDTPYVIHEPRLLAHDILEHVSGPECIGPVYDELKAIGAVALVRPELDNLKYDVANVLATPEPECSLYKPAPVRVLDPVVRRQLRNAAVRGTAMYYVEVEGEEDDILNISRIVYGYLCEGYAQAGAYYGTVAVCDMFDRITQQAKVWSDSWNDDDNVGYTFDLVLDWDEIECYISTEPNEWMEEDYDE